MGDMHKKYIIRCVQGGEMDLLKDFLYEAIFVPKGVNTAPLVHTAR